MGESKYYSCEYLLTLKDANRQVPDIYIADGNRTAGKSVTFKRKLVDTFLANKSDVNQFYYLYTINQHQNLYLQTYSIYKLSWYNNK